MNELINTRTMSKTAVAEIAMLVAVIVAVAISAIRPHSFTVWVTEIFWVAGLLAVLLSTRRMFRFSLVAYACFFVWMLLQSVGAHYTFELVPREERIEWKYGLWGVLPDAFLMRASGVVLWKDIGWYCGRFRCATNPEIGLVVSPFISLAGLAFTIFTIFGKFSLSIVDGWCIYFVGIGKIGQKSEFRLRRDTSVEFEVAPAKNGSEQYWKHDRSTVTTLLRPSGFGLKAMASALDLTPLHASASRTPPSAIRRTSGGLLSRKVARIRYNWSNGLLRRGWGFDIMCAA